MMFSENRYPFFRIMLYLDVVAFPWPEKLTK